MDFDEIDFDDENLETSDSLRLALLAAALTTAADLIATISALKAIDEEKESIKQDAQDQQVLEEQLQNMQQQIDELTQQNQEHINHQNYLIEVLQSMQSQINKLKR
ncbi:hypothetical protein E3U55_06385 [Filobacillus milosensis]|uniref:Uncharacterized protein n=1 Tax=Filobacillus milosensis TaxID=94137 RepID=A0A4Y8IS83_9BACI|nr:hypothetical protein [Filobacillus milosensis]TFB22862.1 hypothetical protein E3U55_06385 [Filobacillus milosensis]